MKIKYIFSLFLVFAFSLGPFLSESGKDENFSSLRFVVPHEEIITDTTVSIEYTDTLWVRSYMAFDFPVILKRGHDISAISLGLYFDSTFLDITGVVLGDSVPGLYYKAEDSLLLIAWSSVAPLRLQDGDTLITIKMNSLDLSALVETLRFRVRETSEFADDSAMTISDVILQMPEIDYMAPHPPDSIGENSVMIYPNPFRDYALIDFTLEMESQVKISIQNPAGSEICTLIDDIYTEGNHQVRIYSSTLGKGIYLVKFEIANSEIKGSKVFKVLNYR